MTFFLMLLKSWKIIVKVMLALIVIGFIASYINRGNVIDDLRAQHSIKTITMQAKHNETILKIEARNYETITNATNKAAEQQKQIERDIADNLAIRAGLRDTISELDAQVSQVSANAKVEYARTLGNVFEQCIGEYAKMARAADGHAKDAQMMRDAWPKN